MVLFLSTIALLKGGLFTFLTVYTFYLLSILLGMDLWSWLPLFITLEYDLTFSTPREILLVISPNGFESFVV